MKLFVLFALVATAIAVPVDEKRPFQPISPLDNNKPPLTTDPKAQSPFVASNPVPARVPLHKRDAPKTTDQKNETPVTNTQKGQSIPNPTSGVVKPSNNRPTRDTQKADDSYKPQPSGIPQKTNVPTPTNTDSKNSNNRPARDTPKTPVNNERTPTNNNNQKNAAPAPTSDVKTPSNNRPARDTPIRPETNDQKPSPVTPQKNKEPVASTNQKPQQNSRNRRDTVKQTENQKPVSWNKDEQKKTNVPAQQPSTVNADRKTRETPKSNDKAKSPSPAPPATDDKRKTRETPKNVPTQNEKNKSPIPTQPEVAKVPTSSRTRRDAPNPAEQSKLVPSGTISGKIDNPSVQGRKDTTTAAPSNHKRDTQGSSIRYPVPVDQVLKHKNGDEKPTVADNSKPQDNSNTKV